MRVLLTGGTGQLGHDLQRTFREHDMVATGRSELDITDRDAVAELVRAVRPDVVVNAAAMTAVDDCETQPERAYAVNDRAVGHLVEAAQDVGAHLVHYSTDYVFDGTATSPYTETDEPNPQSVYGASKLAGERRLRPQDLCIRVSWLVGEHGSNILTTVLGRSARGETLRFVDDQVGSPSFCSDVADLTGRLVAEGATGVIHGANVGAVSWYEYVGDMLEAAGRPRSLVEPIATADLDPPRPAPRPAYSVLAGEALRELGLPPQPHYQVSLRRLVRALTGV